MSARSDRGPLLRCLRLLLVAAVALLSVRPAAAQPGDDLPPIDIPPDEPPPDGESDDLAEGWDGAIRVLRIPGPANAAEQKAAQEIFPDASDVWMHVYGTDPRPIEAARRGLRPWICSSGCDMATPADPTNTSRITPMGRPANQADGMLRSIKVQTPTMPLPLTIWRPRGKPGGPSQAIPTTTGQLLFDPVLLGRRSYDHVCAYPPVSKTTASGNGEVPLCRTGRPRTPTPDSAEMRLGFSWPRSSELSDFQYLAITDTCGNARVIPFQRTFAVPVFHVASGGCGRPDGRVLRVFPSGGWVRVTAFNLDTPATGNVVSATFRVTVPPLEDLVSANTPPLLFPDPRIDDLQIDCGPQILTARPGPDGVPIRGKAAPKGLPGQKAPPGKSLPGQKAPPGMSRPGQKAPPGRAPPDAGDGDKEAPGPRKKPPIMRTQRVLPASSSEGQPMAHQGLVVAPEPLWRGNCRIELHGQTKRRLVAPLALRVRILRTDENATQPEVLDEPWIVTPSSAVFRIPPLGSLMDGESRLRIEIYSDPGSTEGNVILLSDAGRLARLENVASIQDTSRVRRQIGSVTVHTAPLCGESNFETIEGAGSCLRGYFTVPAMLATLQVTRAPWVERPILTRSVLSAVGVAFAFDSYDPVERRAFPIAGHVGGFVQDLGDDRLGILGYVGIAPTVPILGDGGNTTSIGLLGGLGMAYVTRSNGPDEGFKPAAFLSVIVQVGQANPAVSNANGRAFGTYTPAGPPTAGTSSYAPY